MTEIGYQHGIVAGMNGLRDLDPSKTLLKKQGNKWPSIDTLASIPLDQWKAWDKMERAFTILVYDHDAALAGGGNGGGGGGGTPPDPPPSDKKYAPRTHNLGNRDQDPRFCMQGQYGVTQTGGGPGDKYVDQMGCHYDENGMNVDGKRDRSYMVPGLKGAESMDGLEPCDPYTNNGVTFPPYPAESYHQ